MKKPIFLSLAQLLCRFLPPIVSQSARAVIYPRHLAYRHQFPFTTKAQTGSLFQGTTADFHAYPFSVHGYFNWRSWAIALAVCKKGDFILEIGGNIGTESVGFADIVGPQGRVMVFEPLPANIQSLENLCAINRFAHVKVMPVAVGDKPQTVHFVLPPDSHASGIGYISSVPGGSPGRSISVECISLDSLSWDEYGKVNLVFMDAEGAEYAILQGGLNTIQSHRPVIVCEASPKLLRRAGFSLEQFENIIRAQNYVIYEIGKLGLSRLRNMPVPKKADWVCLPAELGHKAVTISNSIFRCACLPCLPGLNPMTSLQAAK